MRKLLIGSLLLIMGCTSQPKEEILTIPLVYGKENITPFEESGYDYSFEIISLEMKEGDSNSIVGRAYQMTKYKNYFYIPEYSTGPKIFDTKGNFVKSLIIGKGPGEVNGMNDLYFDTENDYLEVSLRMDKVNRYTLTGDYIDSVPLKFNCADIYKTGDYYFMYDGILTSDSCMMKIYNYKTDQTIFNLYSKDDMETGSGFMAYNRFVPFDGDIYFNIPYTDCIYKITKGDTTAQKYAKIDNLVYYKNYKTLDLWKLEENAISDNKYVSMNTLAITNDYISFVLDIKTVIKENYAHSLKQRVLYDKSSGRVFRHPISSFDIAYSDGEYEYAIVGAEVIDEKRNDICDSERAVMDKLIESIDSKGIDTNPFIVKLKIFKK